MSRLHRPITSQLTRPQFHRGEFTVGQVKEHLRNEGFLVRNFESDE
jgi:glutamine amidotransferase/cyclase